jgi:uncharacterized membrane protein YqjE
MSQSYSQGYDRASAADSDRVIDPGARSGGAGDSSEGVGSLVSGLVKDLQDLVRGEIRLARAEIKEDAASAGKGAGFIGAGALIGLTGFIFLMLGVTYLLNVWMRMWIAAAIVGLTLTLVAAILVMSGKSKLSASSLKPDRTIDTLKEDKEWASQQISSVKR